MAGRYSFTAKLKSKLGLGTWQLGGPNFVNGEPKGWGFIEENKAINLLIEAISNGIRFFDTSDAYGRGQSESILGKAINASGIPREEFIICTKFGNREIYPDTFILDFSPKWMEQALSLSLKRLQTNYVDVLLFHSPPDNFDWNSYDITLLRKLRSKGIIKQWGVSSKSVYGAKEVMKYEFGDVLQVIYNLIDRRAENLLFNEVSSSKYDFIGRVPLASGFLTSKRLHSLPQSFEKDNYRSSMNEKDINWLNQSVKKLSFLETAGEDLNLAAINFCLSNKDIAVTIPGCRNIDQLLSNLKADTLPRFNQKSEVEVALPSVPEWWIPK